MKTLIGKAKRNKTLIEEKLVENIYKNLQKLFEISPVQKEVLLSHQFEDLAYE